MSGTRQSRLGHKSAQVADVLACEIVKLPNPDGSDPKSDSDGWFSAGDVLDDGWSLVRKLSRHQLIERERNGRKRKTSTVHQWRVKEDIYEDAQEYVERIETLSCGHTGVSNIRGGGFECRECGDPISREEAEAVIG